MSYVRNQDAHERWCPMVRISPGAVPAGHAHGGAVNVALADGKPSRPTAATACIGSKCMMWRFDKSGSDVGYCGLAGRPLSAGD